MVHTVVERRRILLVPCVVLHAGSSGADDSAAARSCARPRPHPARTELAHQRTALVLVARSIRRLQVPEEPRRTRRPSPAARRRALTAAAALRRRNRRRRRRVPTRRRRRDAAPATCRHRCTRRARRHLQVAALDVTTE